MSQKKEKERRRNNLFFGTGYIPSFLSAVQSGKTTMLMSVMDIFTSRKKEVRHEQP